MLVWRELKTVTWNFKEKYKIEDFSTLKFQFLVSTSNLTLLNHIDMSRQKTNNLYLLLRIIILYTFWAKYLATQILKCKVQTISSL